MPRKLAYRIASLCAFSVVALLAGNLCLYGQDLKILANVPDSHRQLLRDRIQEFVNAHKEKNWSKVYDMLGTQYKSAAQKPYNRAEFISRKLYSRISKFVPQAVQKMDENWWMVEGCGTWSDGGKMRASFDAYLEQGTWYFSDIWSVVPCIDCEPESCKINKSPEAKN